MGRLGGVLGASRDVLGHLKASWNQKDEKKPSNINLFWQGNGKRAYLRKRFDFEALCGFVLNWRTICVLCVFGILCVLCVLCVLCALCVLCVLCVL